MLRLYQIHGLLPSAFEIELGAITKPHQTHPHASVQFLPSSSDILSCDTSPPELTRKTRLLCLISNAGQRVVRAGQGEHQRKSREL